MGKVGQNSGAPTMKTDPPSFFSDSHLAAFLWPLAASSMAH